jgi:preprotein translocase subunit YajC
MLGSNVIAAASSGSSSFNPTSLIFIVLIVAVFYLLLIRPQQRRKQQAQQQKNTLQPGAEVVTTAGMYATVTAIDGDDVILEVAPGLEVRFMKRAIMNVVSSPSTVHEEPVEEPVEDEVPVAEADETPAAGTDEGTETVVEETEADTESAYERATGTKHD